MCANGVLVRFHGTRNRDPLLLAMGTDGFMEEFASPGAFYGAAFYFAEKSSYSNAGYAHACVLPGSPSPCAEMLMVRVLCGKGLYMGARIDKAMLRKKDVFDKGFDSVHGGPHPAVPRGSTPTGAESPIWAVYRSAQVYPEYAITYQRSSS